jgi:ABC-type phosphate transport system substrate-binding protein
MKSKIVLGVILAAIMGIVLHFPGVASAGDVVVIVNKNVSASSISGSDLENIFLAKKTEWDNGQKIDFVTLQDCPTHDEFLKKYLQKTSSQFQRYFRTLVFTGKGKAPQAFNTEQSLVEYVAGTAGAIGYVSSGTDTSAVKVLTVN